MKSMVVLFALAAVACGSYIPAAQPHHLPALLLDPHGRPLETAEVINARALHLQAKALEGHYAPHAYAAAPALLATHGYAYGAHASPLLAYSGLGLGLAGHGHYLKKRSLGHLAYSAPLHAASAVSHQSRVDVHTSPAVVAHTYAAPVYSHAVSPVLAPAAVSHQSRLDVRTSPAVVAHTYAAPVYSHAVAPVLAPAAVSHQSRLDLRTSPALYAGAYAAPLAHGYSHSPLAYSGLLHSAPLAHAW